MVSDITLGITPAKSDGSIINPATEPKQPTENTKAEFSDTLAKTKPYIKSPQK